MNIASEIFLALIVSCVVIFLALAIMDERNSNKP